MSGAQEPAGLRTEVRDQILLITLDEPRTRNAITLAMAQAMAGALEQLDADDALRVAVITGAGGYFCSGTNLKRYALGERPELPGRGFAGITAARVRKPLVAAVEGGAVGGGFEIVLACDLIVASAQASFGLPEVRHGLVASAGGLIRLPRRVPHHVAMHCALTGEPLPAARAHALGLVNELAPAGEVLAQALVLARLVAQFSPAAVAASKQVVVESRTWPEHEMFERQAAITEPVHASDAARDGAQAFARGRGVSSDPEIRT